mgnify:CR=1 FL=1
MYLHDFETNIKGSIEVITGPMFSGKSEELIRRLRRADIAGLKSIVFKPLRDNRYSEDSIASHNGTLYKCSKVVKDEEEILDFLKDEIFDIVAIDEVNFFTESIVALCNDLALKGYRVIVAGLDTDFRGEPWSPMPELLAIADSVTKLTSICQKCRGIATRTQRLVNGKPARYSDPLIVVGSNKQNGKKELYEARCRRCHEVYF